MKVRPNPNLPSAVREELRRAGGRGIGDEAIAHAREVAVACTLHVASAAASLVNAVDVVAKSTDADLKERFGVAKRAILSLDSGLREMRANVGSIEPGLRPLFPVTARELRRLCDSMQALLRQVMLARELFDRIDSLPAADAEQATLLFARTLVMLRTGAYFMPEKDVDQ